jgi:predicted ATPase
VITEIEIQGFKSFENVRLKLGGLNLFIGANASGKSNFFDALRVLQGIGYGFTVQEIFNGKPKGAGSDLWEGIRGGAGLASYTKRGRLLSETMQLAVAGTCQEQDFRYTVRLAPQLSEVVYENLEMGSGELLWGDHSRDRPTLLGSLAQKGGSQGDVASDLLRDLGNLQQLFPVADLLRDYSQAPFAQRMGDRGENFAAVVNAIIADRELHSAYFSWLRQLTPMELDGIKILAGALQEPLFALWEGKRLLPAPILSDGTLRFAAIAAAFFQPDMPGIITIEEIENGLHPSRLRLLLELLKSQAGISGPQVFATTHSPVVLAWLEEKDYETTFLFKKDEETGASIVTPLSEIPHLIELVRKQPIGELFTEGWLEGAF